MEMVEGKEVVNVLIFWGCGHQVAINKFVNAELNVANIAVAGWPTPCLHSSINP